MSFRVSLSGRDEDAERLSSAAKQDSHRKDEESENGGMQHGSWRPPYGLLAALAIVVLVIGFGGGFGAGWAAGQDNMSSSDCAVQLPSGGGSSGNLDDINLLRQYTPYRFTSNLSNEATSNYYDQNLILTPALHTLSLVITTLGGANVTFDPNVLRVYIFNKYEGNQNIIANIFNVAQRLQVSPTFLDQIYDITTAMVDIFVYVRDNQAKIGSASGRRMLLDANSAQPLPLQLIKAFIKSGLQSPALAGALGNLTPIFADVDTIVDLVADMYTAVRGLAAETDAMAVTQKNYHPEAPAPPQRTEQVVLGIDGVQVIVNPSRMVVGEEDDPDVADSGTSGRRLLQSMITTPLPAGFVAASPASMPNVLIPTVWHIMLYDCGNGTYGPPGYQSAAAMIARMVAITNYRLAPSKIQVFVKEVHNDPANYRYLVKPSRDAWLSCASPGYFYDSCGEVIAPSVVDFPRAINIFVAGEQPPTDWVGYAFAPGAWDDPIYGHMGLTWTTVSTDGVNNRVSWESGASALVHEIMHHLGMMHTFSDSTCTDGDAPSVTDTPITSGPVWEQPWSQRAVLACMNAWNKALTSNWDTANRQASTRVGIPANDQNSAFDSCPNSPGTDEVANYITYTYDVCLLALGHLTSSQIAAMHQLTADINPTLYNWGQWYALNPPPGALTGSSPPPSSPPPSPPPPSPPPPATSAPTAAPTTAPTPAPTPAPNGGTCTSPTNRGCKCKPSWDYLGSTFTDCVTVPADTAKTGTFCSVDRSNGACANARNGWWDYCTKDPACAGPATASPSPPPPASSPPPPPPAGTSSPPPPPADCGPGAVTSQGLTCTTLNWKIKGDPSLYSGCMNPNNDPKGVWCVLTRGQATSAGTAWDYCQAGCNPTAAPTSAPSGTVTYPNALLCQKGVTGPPNGCSCADPFSITFSGGATYNNQRGCTAYEETSGTGMCVLQCTRAANPNNGKVIACSCTA